MNRDLVFFILCLVFIVGFMGWFIGNLGLEDYLDERSKKKDSDPFKQEKINEQLDELTRSIEESEELQRIRELEQLMNELDKGDDD